MSEIDFINSQQVKNAINKLANNIRTERSTVENLLNIYADKSIIDRLNNHNNQIIYGRRGTGKTHLLYAFQRLIFESNNPNASKRFPIYLDLRTYLPLFTSSSSINVESSVLIFQAIINDLIDILINNLKYIYDISEYGGFNSFENSRIEKLKNILGRLNVEFNGREFKRLGSVEFNKEEIKNISGSLKLNTSPEFTVDGKQEQKNNFIETNVQYLSFNEISKLLEDLSLELNDTKIVFLLDEWSEIPLDLQPYLSELIKRVFISSNYTFKVAAIPYRSKFRETIHNDLKIGLEEGGDIFPITLDNRYIYEIDKVGTKNFYNELLINHLKEIDNTLFNNVDEIRFINYFFANQALAEILIASAGIPRDFINLFILSYNNRNNVTQRIILKNIRNSTTEWYTSDKKEEIDKDKTTRHLFEELVNLVILTKKKTHFLLPQKHSDNKFIKKLVDLRVLHLRQKGISHRHIPNKTYDVYSIDYGSYTSLDINKTTLSTDFSELVSNLNTIEDIRETRSLSIEDDFFEKFNLETGQGIKCSKCSKTIDINHLAYIKQKICNNCFEKVED
ncbi:ATP-binding protein [Chryseobacterium elymi]|uniref:ATP-binding protein n=1 Tax=Chryseobacterium elymi TaxID=395936 RepID=A0A3D9DGZ5_9FLAO|nr:ATP-binding protein [Chryseobacterium elymi]REC77206.1 ATP-binding protein [Chryseobacterium elymi]